MPAVFSVIFGILAESERPCARRVELKSTKTKSRRMRRFILCAPPTLIAESLSTDFAYDTDYSNRAERFVMPEGRRRVGQIKSIQYLPPLICVLWISCLTSRPASFPRSSYQN